MDAANLLNEGFMLMVFGMGFVFVFLSLLVVATQRMSALVGRFLPEPAPKAKASKRPSVAPAQNNDQDGQVMAVISAAVHHHRTRQ
ncbi:OadG family protein [Balneatrix alpica]|uniref:Probable oxaloacetate decarboxylase gamma chain n=1 Tax=Balneatrix alpica TaxID=75684 RepID=A0ABV5Z962_9GAMM|nr:OadG family transporter subunit [Balneatrix alpica]